MIHDVYLERDEEQEAPLSELLRVSAFLGGHTTSGDYMEPVVFFAIGEYTENTHDNAFKTGPERSFTVKAEDLFRALAALGLIDDGKFGANVVLP